MNFQDFFSPLIMIKWNNLNHSLRNAPTVRAFEQNILKFIRLRPNKVYKVRTLITVLFFYNLGNRIDISGVSVHTQYILLINIIGID